MSCLQCLSLESPSLRGEGLLLPDDGRLAPQQSRLDRADRWWRVERVAARMACGGAWGALVTVRGCEAGCGRVERRQETQAGWLDGV